MALCYFVWCDLFQVTRYIQPPLPSPALSLLCHPPTPKLPLPHLASFPSRLQASSKKLSISYSSSEACVLANPSPESCQSVFSTSPDYAFPLTPSSSPPLLSQPCARPTSEILGFPTPPDSLGRKLQGPLQPPNSMPRRRIFDFPCTSSEEALPPPWSQSLLSSRQCDDPGQQLINKGLVDFRSNFNLSVPPPSLPPPPPFHFPPPSSSYPPRTLVDRPPPSFWQKTGGLLLL